MFFKLLTSTTAAVLTAASVGVLADVVRVDVKAQPITTQRQNFIVKYDDGTAERRVAIYEAKGDFYVVETGKPAKPLKGQPVDTRKCNYSAKVYVVRSVGMTDRQGKEYLEPGLTRVYETGANGKGSGPTLTRWHAQTCNDLQSAWEAEFERARNSVRAQVSDVVRADLSRIEQDIRRSDAGVQSISLR